MDSIKAEKALLKDGDPKKTNIIGTFISRICQAAESRVMNCVKDFVEANGFEMRVNMFDGSIIEPTGWFTTRKPGEMPTISPATIATLDAHIFEQTGYNYAVHMVEKPILYRTLPEVCRSIAPFEHTVKPACCC